jgi:hypothetical protein
MIPNSATQGIRRLYFAAVFALLGLVTGCDRYLINICNFRDEWPGCREDVVDASAADLTRGADSPLGSLRKFEWRAKIVNDMKQKFVGILNREYAIMLSTTPTVAFSAAKFQLNEPDKSKRLLEESCSKCPLPTNIKASGDSVYLTNEVAPTFWLLRTVMGAEDESHLIKPNGDLTKVDDNLALDGLRRPFFHPTLDGSLLPTKSAGLQSSDLLRLNVGTTPFVSARTESGIITTAMIGDIDATDPVKNGIEVVRFAFNAVASVYHYDPVNRTQTVDTLLAQKINDEVKKRKADLLNPFVHSYVDDLNGDGFLDFVFSLEGDIFVSSYKGKINTPSLPVFESWPEKVLSVLFDENIQSIMAIDITEDGYPELIVVTDKFVHFYLNTP